MHKRLAVVVAVLAALAFASGAAAATHYFVTNINQIKPSVRAALKGNRGPRGFTGTAGAAGAQGPQGVPGVAGAVGSARAVAVVNADGSFLQGVGFPKNVTGVSHTGGSGIYCIILSGGFDPSDAMATLSQGFISDGYSVSANPDSPDCASGEAEVDTFALEQSGTTTAGTPIEAVPADAGFTVLVP